MVYRRRPVGTLPPARSRDYLQIARMYEDEVRAGDVPACRWVRLACDRNARDRKRAGKRGFPYRFAPARAIAICQAVELMPHIKGPKAKQRLVNGEWRWATLHLEPWQIWILTTVFGWVRDIDGLRRFRTVLVLVPRKNAKSTISAAVGNYQFSAARDSGVEVYSAATTRDQAKIVFGIAQEMARRSPQFREFFGVHVGAKAMTIEATASKFEPLSSDAHNLDGLNVSTAIIDELHAHRTRQVWDVIETATGAREEPLIWAISTAGADIAGICYEVLTYQRRILERGIRDETFFGIEYAIDEDDDWKAEASWRKANPNFGVSVDPGDLARKALKARHSPAAVNNFLTKHLNVWVKGETSWMPMEAWHHCAAPKATASIEAWLAFPCWIGVDLSEVRDIAAIVALFRAQGRRYAAFGRFYLPAETVDRSPIAQYSGWVRSGYLIATPGNATDYTRIETDIGAWCETLPHVQEVCFDRALAAQMGQRLAERLGRKPPVITVNQSVDILNPVLQDVEAAVLERRFQHPGDPVLTWAASNIVVARNHKGEIFPRKAGGKDSHNKIDPMSALFTAWSRAMAMPESTRQRASRMPKIWTKAGWVPAIAPAPAEVYP